MRALARLRWIAFLGGWPPIPEGGALRPEGLDNRVPLLRARLWLEGAVVEPTNDDSTRYDAGLVAAVRAYQFRNGLADDGVVGAATLASLNVPIETRIDGLRVNLERVRRMGHTLPDTFVGVNIAAARIQVIGGDDVVFASRAVVGRLETPTPTFSARLQYIELNPTWTVPSGIVDEILTLQRTDADYMHEQGMRLLDATGQEVEPTAVDFSRYDAEDFPYVIRQDPGPKNPLGRIKLMLPNEHHVYLHDTPERHLFAAERRLFSHGCVRVADPVGLAEVVLADTAWTRDALEAAIAEGGTRTIALARPLPVFVVYWTATADSHGLPGFHPDVYGLDEAALAELERGVEGTSGGASQ